MNRSGRSAFATLLLVGVTLAPAAAVYANGPEPSVDAGRRLPTTCPTTLPSGSIATVLGTGEAGYSGDGGLATAATFNPSFGTIAIDEAGAVLLTDEGGPTIRRIGREGVIVAIAGPATGAPFIAPAGVALDPAGDVYVADFGASRIWMVNPDGTVTGIAGTGVSGSLGDGGPADEAQINAGGLAIGPGGVLIIDDVERYRLVDAEGVIRAFAGTGIPGFSGDGGPAAEAAFHTGPHAGMAVAEDGSVFLSDAYNHRIRKVDGAGIVTTVAGTGEPGSSGDGGPALQARLTEPHGLAVDAAGNLYVADYQAARIRRIDSAGIITTVAGTGVRGFAGDCGPATDALLDHPIQVALRDGILYIVDADNARVRMVVP